MGKGDKRKVYTEEYKHEAVAQTRLPNATVEGVERDLGMSSSALYKWIRAEKEAMGLGKPAFPGHGKVVMSEEQAEIARLKKELAIVKEEREILVKATARLGQNGTPWGLPASSPS
jgi:transposase